MDDEFCDGPLDQTDKQCCEECLTMHYYCITCGAVCHGYNHVRGENNGRPELLN